MSASRTTLLSDGAATWREADQFAGAFIAGFRSADTRRGYQADLRCWFEFCGRLQLHHFRKLRRTHLELYLREYRRARARWFRTRPT